MPFDLAFQMKCKKCNNVEIIGFDRYNTFYALG